MADFTDRWWTSGDGLRLHARDYAGAGGDARQAVVCIHGLTRNSADFEAIAPDIAATGRRVLALDVRGRGRSARAADPMTYQPPTYAADVVVLMRAAGLAQAVFLGTSMGGLITMALSATRPDLVSAVILNDVGPELSPVGLARIAAYAGQAQAPVADWSGAAAYARRTNAVAFPHYDEADWQAFARRLFVETPAGRPVLAYDADIAVPIRAGLLAPDLWPLFTGMASSRPTMLVRGAISDLIDAPIAARMKAAVPAMRVVEVPGVGHAPMLDEPEAKTAILEFLDRVP